VFPYQLLKKRRRVPINKASRRRRLLPNFQRKKIQAEDSS